MVRDARRFGILLILLTALFRIFQFGLPQQLIIHLHSQYFQRETGQIVRSFSAKKQLLTESAPLSDSGGKPPVRVFTPEDAEKIAIANFGKKQPDFGQLLASPLSMKLSGSAPTVLILHAHATESYRAEYTASAAYRTLDEHYNMLSIGDCLAHELEANGIRVIHDRQLHDYPSYQNAYVHARNSLQELLKQNDGIQLILDLHRDASDGSRQLTTHADIDGKDSSQLMLVLATGSDNFPNPNWQQNLAYALKLQTVLERQYPGICRPICLRPQRFNQDLGPTTLLVEVGAAGDTHEQAILAAKALSVGILRLRNGSERREAELLG